MKVLPHFLSVNSFQVRETKVPSIVCVCWGGGSEKEGGSELQSCRVGMFTEDFWLTSLSCCEKRRKEEDED